MNTYVLTRRRVLYELGLGIGLLCMSGFLSSLYLEVWRNSSSFIDIAIGVLMAVSATLSVLFLTGRLPLAHLEATVVDNTLFVTKGSHLIVGSISDVRMVDNNATTFALRIAQHRILVPKTPTARNLANLIGSHKPQD